MAVIALVLKSGGRYGVNHVEALRKQIWEHAGQSAMCLTDFPGAGVPLKHGLPGWWSKMELFRPDIRGDLLYFDLDTLIVGSLQDIAKVNRTTLLRDFYSEGVYAGRAKRLGSGMMYLKEEDRAAVWQDFMRSPRQAMVDCAKGGDQQFLERHFIETAQRWQDLVPEQVVSYKVHCKSGVPANARVICAHGKPKFWDIQQYKHLYG